MLACWLQDWEQLHGEFPASYWSKYSTDIAHYILIYIYLRVAVAGLERVRFVIRTAAFAPSQLEHSIVLECCVNLTSFMSALEFLSSNCENCFGQLDGELDKWTIPKILQVQVGACFAFPSLSLSVASLIKEQLYSTRSTLNLKRYSLCMLRCPLPLLPRYFFTNTQVQR